ncbi:GNAT family N-acetyltransferase [Mesoflavibacter profundi]|uniref:GNAT family N-acetyltransferase n=1 Tax=Mesoflavibacter profundi TaxID=2708110 RepID=UPI003517E5A6
MKIITQTNRLFLRPFSVTDANNFYLLNKDPEVLKYTGDKPFTSINEAKQFLLNYKEYEQHNMGRWAVCDKKTDQFLGWCGLKFHPSENKVEVGYRFFKQFWNNGYATESCQAALTYGFTKLHLQTIYAHAHIENYASHKVLEKCNMQLIKTFNYSGMPANLYKIENPDIEIKQITALQTYPVRHPVLRTGRPIEDCKLTFDDHQDTFHLGLYFKNKLSGVVSLMKLNNEKFEEQNQYRLRGMGVLEEFQGYGFGRSLVETAQTIVKQKGAKLLWFDARLIAVGFYKKLGFTIIGDQFEVPKVGPHYVMYKRL